MLDILVKNIRNIKFTTFSRISTFISSGKRGAALRAKKT